MKTDSCCYCSFGKKLNSGPFLLQMVSFFRIFIDEFLCKYFFKLKTMIQKWFLSIVLIFSYSFLYSQLELTEPAEEEDAGIKVFIGASTDFLSVRSNTRFGLWSSRRNTGAPFDRFNRSSSSFSILPYVGIRLSENVDLGIAYNHRGESSRATIEEGEVDPVEINFSTKSSLNGIGFFSRISVYNENKFSVFLRPALKYYFEDYKEFRDSRKDLQIKDRFIFLNLGVGLSYAFSEQIRAHARFSGISYVNGRWREVGTDIGESYSEAGRNYSRSGIYLGVDYTF